MTGGWRCFRSEMQRLSSRFKRQWSKQKNRKKFLKSIAAHGSKLLLIERVPSKSQNMCRMALSCLISEIMTINHRPNIKTLEKNCLKRKLSNWGRQKSKGRNKHNLKKLKRSKRRKKKVRVCLRSWTSSLKSCLAKCKSRLRSASESEKNWNSSES